jgi:hypothetical protein
MQCVPTSKLVGAVLDAAYSRRSQALASTVTRERAEDHKHIQSLQSSAQEGILQKLSKLYRRCFIAHLRCLFQPF